MFSFRSEVDGIWYKISFPAAILELHSTVSESFSCISIRKEVWFFLRNTCKVPCHKCCLWMTFVLSTQEDKKVNFTIRILFKTNATKHQQPLTHLRYPWVSNYCCSVLQKGSVEHFWESGRTWCSWWYWWFLRLRFLFLWRKFYCHVGFLFHRCFLFESMVTKIQNSRCVVLWLSMVVSAFLGSRESTTIHSGHPVPNAKVVGF